MHPRGSANNRQRVLTYATRVVSLSYGVQINFDVDGFQFRFRIYPDNKCGSILEVNTDSPNPEELVMLIAGLSPCKDTAFRPNGSFVRRLPPQMFRLSTRLAIRDPNRRRRKYLQELRLAEAAQYD